MSDAVLQLGVPRGAYPERLDPALGWLDRQGERAAAALRRLARERGPAGRLVEDAARHGAALAPLADEALASVARELRDELRHSRLAPDAVARAFALIRELAERSISLRHYDVQMLGGQVLLRGGVAEMETGEGKTLTATLAAGTAALAGIPTHVVTVNDYLAQRDADWMGPVYRALGLSVGAIQHGMTPEQRREVYRCDVTYCSNKEVAFDYLRDRIVLGRDATRIRLSVERLFEGESRADRVVLRGLCFGIVDEADSVLVDEARTPLIISHRVEETGEAEVYRTAIELAGMLVPREDFTISERERTLRLTDAGRDRIEDAAQPLGGVWAGRQRREDLIRQALTALHVLEKDRDYLVKDGQVQIVDEYTGRLMSDRSWEHGLHQLVDVKEGVELSGRQEPRARISYQRFFRRYLRLAGMTGTAREVAGELGAVYGLPVVRVPTNAPVRRRDLGQRLFASADEKWDAVVRSIRDVHARGRPVLVGTRSVAASEQLAARLAAAGLPHRVLNARQDEAEAEVVAQAGQPAQITVATNMAGRGTDIRLGPGVAERGGLHVIATEPHEARRIDRQLWGRCGRQGDPGSFETFASLDDEVFERYAPPALRRVARSPRFGVLAVRGAQRRAERAHARARRRLMRVDEQLEAALAFSGPGE